MAGLLDSRAMIPPDAFGGYLSRQRKLTPEEMNQAGDFHKGLAGGLLGMPADLAQLGASIWAGGMGAPAPDVPLTSEKIGGLLGADTNSGGFNIGLIGAPDPGDIAKLAGRGLLALPLFHGSPHKFDRFDLSKIGTGEGAQAYGHGLYFAENPGVAGSYRESLSDFDIFVGGEKVDLSSSTDEAAILDVLKAQAGRDGLRSNSIPEDTIRNLRDYFIEAGQSEDLATLDRLVDKGISVKQSGHLYEIDYPDELFDKMLDWDAPLSEQPEILKIRDRLQVEFDSKYPAQINDIKSAETGEELYRSIVNHGHSPAQASDMLREVGIPGIKYYDGSSRSAGEGTRNIVVFNPDDIRMVKRDGEIVYNATGFK